MKYLIVFLLFLPISFAIEVNCYDDGSIIISEVAQKDRVFASVPGIDKEVRVEGKWQGAEQLTFFSKEMIFTEPNPMQYRVRVGFENEYFWCPGFRFSCRMINTSIISCFSDKNFSARFFVYNFDVDEQRTFRFEEPGDFIYEITTDKGKYVNGPNVKSHKFSDYDISKKEFSNGNLFKLDWKNNETVRSFSIRYRCDETDYYVVKECTRAVTCLFDEDCKSNQECLDYYCLQKVCGDCEYVSNHECVRHECCNNDECDGNQVCKDNVCTDLVCGQGFVPLRHKCLKYFEDNKEEVVQPKANTTIYYEPVDRRTFFEKLLDWLRGAFSNG